MRRTNVSAFKLSSYLLIVNSTEYWYAALNKLLTPTKEKLLHRGRWEYIDFRNGCRPKNSAISPLLQAYLLTTLPSLLNLEHTYTWDTKVLCCGGSLRQQFGREGRVIILLGPFELSTPEHSCLSSRYMPFLLCKEYWNCMVNVRTNLKLNLKFYRISSIWFWFIAHTVGEMWVWTCLDVYISTIRKISKIRLSMKLWDPAIILYCEGLKK